jgi:penicillin G amidase
MRRFLLKALAVIVVLVAITALAAYHYLRRSLPVIDGTITVAGVSAPVEIVRDADAIPHIFAATKADALFGLGYVHAQDRLWQMEFQRRIGHGRLSEIFGAATIPQDRFLRTVGFGRAATRAWDATPDWAKQQVNEYIAGVNAFIATHHGAGLPPEFSLLRFEPEPWTGPDVLAWVKMMAWDLSANYGFEILRNDLAHAVGLERMRQLMPPYPRNGLSILDGSGRSGEPGESGASTYEAHQSYLPFQPFPPVDGLGSNNWVVDGTMTASGKPMLANDPHLGTRIPSTWYLAHLSAGDFEVIGATLPGTPAVALGRNRRIAWGATNVAADVEDLYREHIDDAKRTAEFRGAQEPLTIVRETILVKGGPPVTIDARLTRHGPLVSDAINAQYAESKRTPRHPPVEPLAFRWTALDREDTTLASFLKLNEARNWSDFTAALRDFVVPSQNFVYADVDGHIGYYAPGRIPMRASGDGTLPADGWTGDAEWTGWIPFEELPHLFDPPSHFIVTANNRPAPPEYPHILGFDWYEPYRAQRIVDLLSGRSKLTPDDFARIQADTFSMHAKSLLPLLLAHAHPEDEADRRAIEILQPWNFEASGASGAEAIFEAWFYELAPALVGDALGPIVTESYNTRSTFVSRFVVNTLTAPGDTSAADRAVTKALHEGVADLARRLGSDMTRWRWDAVHHAVFPHQGLDAVAALRPIVSRSIPSAGDWSTVDVGTVAADSKYEQHLVPGYREIIDLSPANDSRFLDAVGQSGHPLSPDYDRFLPDWRAVKYRAMTMNRAQIEAAARGRLRLVP